MPRKPVQEPPLLSPRIKLEDDEPPAWGEDPADLRERRAHIVKMVEGDARDRPIERCIRERNSFGGSRHKFELGPALGPRPPSTLVGFEDHHARTTAGDGLHNRAGPSANVEERVG